MAVIPYEDREEGKKKQVADMFDNISHRYDLLNHLLSMRIDVLWRKKAIRLLRRYSPKTILDIATGTGDLAIEFAKRSNNGTKVIAADFCEPMLEIAKKKTSRLNLNSKFG